MEKVFFRPGQSYVGDVIPSYENGVYYLFFLNDRRKTDRTADQTDWGLVTTRDFVHYEDHGIVLPNSPVTEADNCCYTGCVCSTRRIITTIRPLWMKMAIPSRR